MQITRFAPIAALLFTAGCAYDGQAQGYDPGTPPPGYPQQGYPQQGYPQQAYDPAAADGVIQPGDLFGGRDVASVDVFYAPLAPYGRWVESRYGRAFAPNVDRNGRPYVNGRWADDRLWISDDPWGWATDHYGRWGFDERIGWVWVPDVQWAPSWVAWRENDGVTGWAPIPPGVSYSVSVGFGGGFGYDDWNSWYGPSWVWVPNGYLYRPHFGNQILPWRNGFTYWQGSRWNWHSGWDGRPGYARPGGWHGNDRDGGAAYNHAYPAQGRPGQPGYGQNGYGRPDGGQNGYGRPDGGRPGQGQNGYGRPNGGQPGYGQPGTGRPDGGRPGVSETIGGAIAGQPQGGRPAGQTWQGRPGQPGESWQGRPGQQGQPQPAQPGAGHGQPDNWHSQVNAVPNGQVEVWRGRPNTAPAGNPYPGGGGARSGGGNGGGGNGGGGNGGGGGGGQPHGGMAPPPAMARPMPAMAPPPPRPPEPRQAPPAPHNAAAGNHHERPQ